MDVLLMLRGETRHCGDCGTATIFVPVEAGDEGWACTVCDAAVVVTVTVQGSVAAA